MKKSIWILAIVVLLLIGFFVFQKTEQRTFVSSENISGAISKNQVWSGNISVTGDVIVKRGVTLTILPGTIVTVTSFSDDQRGGRDHARDEPFPKDPDRKETSSTIIQINGILNASGAPENKIIFTTDKKQTTYDWDGLSIDRGVLNYAIVEYARYNRIQETSEVVISNSTIRNSLECCLCIGHANPISPKILNNDIYNCGHEGIDIGGGSATIKGNYFHVENPEIQPEPLWGRVGVVIYQNSYPVLEENRFEKLLWAILLLDAPGQDKKDKQAIVRNNIMQDNEVAFSISSGYVRDAVLRENNTLINNTNEEIED